MRQDAMAQGNIACQKYETEKDIAKHVRIKFFEPFSSANDVRRIECTV